MPDPFRLRVMKGICAALKTITVENGYQHDMGDFEDSAGRTVERVFRGRDFFGDNDPLPMLSILEDPRSPEGLNGSTTSGKSQNPFRVLIQGFTKDDKKNPLDPAYMLSADTIKALVSAKQASTGILGLNQPLRAPCVMGMSIGQPVHRPGNDEISEHAYFLVGVTLILAEELERPFDLP
jgi:hypothetical protein